MKSTKFYRAMKWVVCLVGITGAIALSAICWYLVPTARRIDAASAWLLDCKLNRACLPSQTLATVGAIKATSGEVAKAAPAIAASARAASEQSVIASREAAGAAREGKLLLEDSRGLVNDLRSALADLRTETGKLGDEAARLLESTDTTVQSAGQTLQSISGLAATLDKQVTEGAPEAKRTLAALADLASDPALKRTLESIDGGSYHAAQIAETIDIATRDLRKRIGRVQWLIKRITSLLSIPIRF